MNTISNNQVTQAWVEHPKYLGDRRVVAALLQAWAADILDSDHDDHEALLRRIDRKSRALARVFLGLDDRFSRAGWNQPGEFDVWLTRRSQCHPADPPEQRVGGVLLQLLRKLYELQYDMNEY